ncbi:MAG TPA: hypothetical protein VF918_22280, partial [Anaerolineales bacterium]
MLRFNLAFFSRDALHLDRLPGLPPKALGTVVLRLSPGLLRWSHLKVSRGGNATPLHPDPRR